MVPPVEGNAYMYELRNIAENIVRERCEYLEVVPPSQSGPRCGDRVQGDRPVGPAFHIPMTQDKTLEELPSQLEFDWQDSVSPKNTPTGAEATDVPPTHPQESAFIEVSQIAHEAVVDATHQQTERDTDVATTSTSMPP